MESQTARPSLPAILAVGAFGLLSLLGGWLVVRGGGFFHSPGKYSADAVFIGGLPAVFMALLQLLASALAFTWLLRLRLAPAVSAYLAFGTVLLPPLLYVLLGTGVSG